jgi:hypothetical protein
MNVNMTSISLTNITTSYFAGESLMLKKQLLQFALTTTKRATYSIPSICALFLVFFSQLVNATEANWSCLETSYHSIYESTEGTQSRVDQNRKDLQWINQDTIGFQSFTLRRSDHRSNIFVNDDGDVKTVYINDKETPYLIALMEPQTWMNKFGHLRVRFYRCLP